MGIFITRMPKGIDEFEIQNRITQLKYHNEVFPRTNNVLGFLNAIKDVKEDFIFLKRYEKKYPKYFNPKPSDALAQFNSNMPMIERNFIDRYVQTIERKLLDYSTIRGKRNNLNKMVDIFRYYAEEFLPETLEYFDEILKSRFSDYL